MKTKYMSTLLALVVAATAITFTTGCRTTDATTGEVVFDPVRTAKVQAAIKPAIATGVLIGCRQEAKAYPAFVLAGEVLQDLASRKQIDPNVVNSALLSLNITDLENADAKLAVQVGVNTALAIYNAAAADSLRADIAEDEYLLAILQTLADGVALGVQQAEEAGLTGQ